MWKRPLARRWPRCARRSGGYRAKGLSAEVEQARQTLDAAGVRLLCGEAPPSLRAREETVLALIVREAVTNIVRHAHATECEMRFRTTDDGHALLEVADNGRGAIEREGNGLRGDARARAGAWRPVSDRFGGRHTLDDRAAAAGLAPEGRGGVMKIKVVLAEDQAMVLGALAALLELEADIEVVARAANGRDALRAAEQLAPDVLVTDIEMPGMTGLEVTAALRLSRPAVRTVILTTFARPGYLRRALDSGARGYLLKDRPATELADAVRRVHRGLRVVDPGLATEAWSAEDDPLTDRERQILQRAGEGRSTGEIAADLRLSEGTVRNYLSEAISKLNATIGWMPHGSRGARAGCSENLTRLPWHPTLHENVCALPRA